MSVTGEEGAAPVKCGVPVGDFCAGLYAAYTIAAALLEARRSGHGAFIDCSMLGSMIGVAPLQTLSDPQVAAMNLVRPLSLPNGVETRTTAFPVSMSNYDFNVYRPPPMLGAHTEEVFEEWLSSSADEPTTTNRRRRSQ